MIDGHEIEAIIDLNEAEREKLAIVWNNNTTIQLHVSVAIKNKEIKVASIIGIGSPRTGTEQISKLLN